MKNDVWRVPLGAVSAGIAAGAAATLFAGTAMAEDVLRSLTAFPSTDNASIMYQEFVAAVNSRGEGIVQIQVVGGPEVVPGQQQIEAVGRNTVDMTYAPIGFALGTMPEADAWVGSNVLPAEQRANGGLDLIQQIASEKLGVHTLSRLVPAAPFNIFLTVEPNFDETGNLDLSGARLRASPGYNAFFEALGAVPVNVQSPDIFTGLERGTFDGMGYTATSMEGWGWEKFLKYRVEPGFFQTDIGIFVSNSAWDGLSDEAKEILTQTAEEFEQSTYEKGQALDAEVKAEFDAGGMQVIELEGDAKTAYLDAAYSAIWARLEASGSPYYADLRDRYFAE